MKIPTQFPDETSTRLEIALSVLVLGFTLTSMLFTDTGLYWVWVGIGIILGYLSIGPLSHSKTGVQLGEWFQSITISKRAAVIAILFSFILIVISQVNPSIAITYNLFLGIAISILLYAIGYYIKNKT